MKIKSSKTPTRSFISIAPNWIKPIYDVVQTNLNNVLTNSSYTNQLINLPLTKIRKDGKVGKRPNGELWHDIQTIIGNPLKGLINNSAWYNRILMTNLISLIKSHQDQVKIWHILKQNKMKINNQLRDALAKENLFPTNTALTNLVKAKSIPDLPTHCTLKLNYAFSDKQMFTMDEHLNCKVQIYSTKYAKDHQVSAWKTFQIYLPSYIHDDQLTKICKPVFIYQKKFDQIICQIPYQLKISKHEAFENILGIDLGKVKLYSGTVLHPNGTYSQEYLPSKHLDQLMFKHNRINQHVNCVYNRWKRINKYGISRIKPLVWQEKQNTRYQDYQYARQKRTRLKEQIEWLMANEIVSIALNEHCKTIHMENLTWVNNIGGKWDFSKIVQHVQYAVELAGIQLILVSAKNTSRKNPITKQIGKFNQREVVFDNLKIDRDQLASLNIALRDTNIKIKDLHIRKARRIHRPSKRKIDYYNKYKQFCLNKIKNTQIVMFLCKQAQLIMLALTSLNKSIRLYSNNNLARRNQLSLLKNTDFN